MNTFLILSGKAISKLVKFFNLGSGSTWPGHIALFLDKNFIKNVLKSNSKLKIILIAGTNGKTTTGKLIQTILEKNKKLVFQNSAGANLLNGIASSLVLQSNLTGKINYDYAVFEIDENSLPKILEEIPNPDYILLLNLFRDQLDRYGEVNTIAAKWKEALTYLDKRSTLILNADDPQIASLALNLENLKIEYFGISSIQKGNKIQHASDSTYCPKCGEKLFYKSVYFSHLGDWECKECENIRPKKVFTSSPTFPLSGIYNEYNTNAAVLLGHVLKFNDDNIKIALEDFKPAFGRQETLIFNDKKIQILLSKNPTSLNESLRTIAGLKAKNLLLILNDRIPDGRDVSWIWDVDFENFLFQFKKITVSGDRTYDMALRLKYAEIKDVKTEGDLAKAVNVATQKTGKNETLFILPTYSAMLETRKILTGKKIL